MKAWLLVILYLFMMFSFPIIIFNTGETIITCSVISAVLAGIIVFLAREVDPKSLRSRYFITYFHLCIVVIYSIIGMFVIGWFMDGEYYLKEIGQSSSLYVIYLILAFILEHIYILKREERIRNLESKIEDGMFDYDKSVKLKREIADLYREGKLSREEAKELDDKILLP